MSKLTKFQTASSISDLKRLQKVTLFKTPDGKEFVPFRMVSLHQIIEELEKRGMKDAHLFEYSSDFEEEIDNYWRKLSLDVDTIDFSRTTSRTVSLVLLKYLNEQPLPLMNINAFPAAKVATAEGLMDCLRNIGVEYKEIVHAILQLLNKVVTAGQCPFNAAGFGKLLEHSFFGTSGNSHSQKIISQLITTDKLPKIEQSRVFEEPSPLTDQDWKLLLAGCKTKTYSKGDHILEEGQFNYFLFRVKEGKVRVEKTGNVLCVLGEKTVLGEMSILGSYETSATVIAHENGVVMQLIDCSYIENIFKTKPELCMRFTWAITHKLCSRLASLPAAKKSWKDKAATSKAQLERKQSRVGKVVQVFFKDNTYRAFMVMPGESSVVLRDNIIKKMKYKRANTFKLYYVEDSLKHAMAIEQTADVYALVKEHSQKPGFKLVFSDRAPKIRKKKLEASEAFSNYSCKLDKKSGTLFIDEKNNIWHQHKRLGFVSKHTFEPETIESIAQPNPTEIHVLQQLKRKETHRLAFQDNKTATEAFTIFKNIVVTKTPEEMQDLEEKEEKEEEATDAIDDEIVFCRAVVVEPYNPRTPGELSLNAQDMILVLDKGIDGWWIGENGENIGLFPGKNVKELYEPDVANQLQDAGYRSVQGIATKEDWRLLLLGGQEKKLAKGDVVLKENEKFERIYQISSGSCRIEKAADDGSNTVLGKMKMDETFGEISFLKGTGATASIVADEESIIYVIEASYFKRLFNADPGLAGRFFKYLGTSLEMRLRARETALAK